MASGSQCAQLGKHSCLKLASVLFPGWPRSLLLSVNSHSCPVDRPVEQLFLWWQHRAGPVTRPAFAQRDCYSNMSFPSPVWSGWFHWPWGYRLPPFPFWLSAGPLSLVVTGGGISTCYGGASCLSLPSGKLRRLKREFERQLLGRVIFHSEGCTGLNKANHWLQGLVRGFL